MSERYQRGFKVEEAPDHGVLETGFETIDVHLMKDFEGNSLGGLPRGGFYEISGTTQSGKSRLCYNIGGHEQEHGGVVALGDAEQRFMLTAGAKYVQACGLDLSPEKFLYIGPDKNGRFILDTMFETIRQIAMEGAATLFIIDSLAALQPQSIADYIDGKSKSSDGASKRKGDSFQSGQSGTVSMAQLNALREVVPVCVKHGLTVLMINHRRKNPSPVGRDDYAPGSTAKDHALNASLCLRGAKRRPDGSIEVKVTVEKSNVSSASGLRTGLKGEGDIPNLIIPAPVKLED